MRKQLSNTTLVFSLALSATALPGAVPALLPSAAACHTLLLVGVVSAVDSQAGTVQITYESAGKTQTVTATIDRTQRKELRPQVRVEFELDEAGNVLSVRALKDDKAPAHS